MKLCDICGNPFEPGVHNALRCSMACVRVYRTRWMRAHHKKAPIRTASCKCCGVIVHLKPKTSLSRVACDSCRPKLWKERTVRFLNTEKAKILYRRHAKSEKRIVWLKAWRKKNRVKHREQDKIERAQNPELRITQSLRSRLCAYVKRKKSHSTHMLLGCTPAELRAHLEARFKPGMNWQTYGRKGWHIDHVRPLGSFQFYNQDGTENTDAFRQAMHFTNLQPLWYWENASKGDTFIAI